VILLLWLYISSIAFLFGAELNSVVDRQGGAARRPAPAARTQAQAGTNGQPGDGYGRDVLAPPQGSVSRH
jgi:uncharacterized BrkB/YihY/UPF0761 family membrane protein